MNCLTILFYRTGALLLLVAFVIADNNSHYNGYVGPCPYNNTGAKFSPSDVSYFDLEYFYDVAEFFSNKQLVGTWYFVAGTYNPYEPDTDCPSELISYNTSTNIWQSIKSAYNRT